MHKAKKDLIRLATAGDPKAFYDLEIEQLCGQMNAAAQALLDYPERHSDLLSCLAALAETEDVEILLTPSTPQVPGQPKPQALVDARARVIHQVQRSIDGFQISAGFRWKWLLQVTSFGVSFLITGIGFSLSQPSVAKALETPWTRTQWITVVLVGLAGGFLAPIARDLIASLQKLRS
ncbi:hypothetical protein SFMTTN_3500 [Sulfuriferula multivorans]|uniref:Uncharacterized protein n=1 Tax=Sulfuriferula multivorans TaxID=1559896 RepID=A0A401JHV6_9PROT|nr:hypothetical protein SFMTTN_3500 [Sulfuriferula multivorans]